MKSKSISISILVILLVTGSVFGYGSATHTYFANKLGCKKGILNLHEMYGSVVPDMFNLLFDHPNQEQLWFLTHYGYMNVVNKANTACMEAFAYGFKSHNEFDGADYTAHINSLTLPGDDGYVNIKRKVVADKIQSKVDQLLESIGEYDEVLAEELALRIADTAVESAIDYLVSRNEDPSVGIRMAMASIARSPTIPVLLCRAYIWDLMFGLGMSFGDAVTLVYGAEEQFREYMLLYGIMLSSPHALDLMAEQGALLAEQILLHEYGISTTVPHILLKRCLCIAIRTVKNDYSNELAATLNMLEAQM